MSRRRCSLRESRHPCSPRGSACPDCCSSSASGWLLGTDGLGWIDFNDYELARTIGVVALALILFEGGLTAGFEEIRPVLRPALSLAILGTLGTCVICGLAASWLLDLSTLEGMQLGAIISATDGAAIFALLRESTLRRPIARTLEGESGFNDPVAVLLVIGFIDWIEQPDYGVLDMLLLFVREMGIGAVVGVGVGSARGVGAPPHAAGQRRAVPGRHAVRRRPRLRRRRDAARVRASSRPTSPAWCSGRAGSRRSRR